MERPSAVDARDDALARAKHEADRRVLLAFATLLCVPIAPLVLIASLIAWPRERRLGLSRSSTPTAIGISAFATLYATLAIGTMGWATWAYSNRSPELVVANGHEEDIVEVEIDDRVVATVAPGESRVIPMAPGSFSVSGELRGPRGARYVHGRRISLAAGERVLWNPNWTARFVAIDGPADPAWYPLPRAEWLDLSPYRYAFGQATPIRLGARAELAWGRSEPNVIAAVNPYAVAIDVRIDDVSYVIEPDHWQEIWAREGPHDVLVTADGAAVFHRRVETGDYSAFVLDPEGGTDFVVCRVLADGRVHGEPLPRSDWHDVSAHDEVLEAATPIADLRTIDDPTWVTWADPGCADD